MQEIKTLEDFVISIPANADTVISKARYLYLELGKRSFYDTRYKYYMFGEEESMLEYSQKTYTNPNIIICKTLTQQYSKLLTLSGIKNNLATEENGAHYFVVFYDENDCKHIADLTNDLKNIQFRCKTQYFGSDTISEQELKEEDLKLGYISKERGYSDDYWYIVRDTLKDANSLNDKQKLDIVLQNLYRFGDIKKPGNNEIVYIYQKYIRYCLPDSTTTFCSTKTNYSAKENISIILRTQNNSFTYMFNPTTRLFEEEKTQSLIKRTIPEKENNER